MITQKLNLIFNCRLCSARAEKSIDVALTHKFMHNRVHPSLLPKGWEYTDIPAEGYDPYMKHEFKTVENVLVCPSCK